MADDVIRITTAFKIDNGNVQLTTPSITTRFDQATARADKGKTHTISSSEETISFGDVAPGWIRITNLDLTNVVNYGVFTGKLFFQCLPNNGVGLFYLIAGSDLIVQAPSGDCDIVIEAATV